MLTNGYQYEARLCSLCLRLAGRADQLDYAWRLPAGLSQRPQVVAVCHAGQAGDYVAKVNEGVFAVGPNERDRAKLEDLLKRLPFTP